MSSNELNLKLILIGDSNVGKTTILLNYIQNDFNEFMNPTLGLENRVKIVDIQGFKAKVQIWDTAGQEKFNALTQQFFRNTDGILLIFDLTDKNSFNNIKKWLNDVKANSDHSIKKILIGNKSDMKDQICVTKNMIDNFCNEKELKYMEVSAKNNENVSNAFETLINEIIGNRTNDEILEDFGINDHTLSLSYSNINYLTSSKKKKCC
jgi:small GTP-binding protein